MGDLLRLSPWSGGLCRQAQAGAPGKFFLARLAHSCETDFRVLCCVVAAFLIKREKRF